MKKMVLFLLVLVCSLTELVAQNNRIHTYECDSINLLLYSYEANAITYFTIYDVMPLREYCVFYLTVYKEGELLFNNSIRLVKFSDEYDINSTPTYSFSVESSLVGDVEYGYVNNKIAVAQKGYIVVNLLSY